MTKGAANPMAVAASPLLAAGMGAAFKLCFLSNSTSSLASSVGAGFRFGTIRNPSAATAPAHIHG